MNALLTPPPHRASPATPSPPAWGDGWTAATAASACGYLVVAATNPSPWIRWPALGGAVLVTVALVVASHSRWLALVALDVGALVPVVAT